MSDASDVSGDDDGVNVYVDATKMMMIVCYLCLHYLI